MVESIIMWVVMWLSHEQLVKASHIMFLYPAPEIKRCYTKVDPIGRMTKLEGIIEGFDVLTSADVKPDREIYKGKGYRLYTAQVSGKVVAIKLYEGRHAKKKCLEAAKFSQNLMHPNIQHMIAVSPRKSGPPFLVFNGGSYGSRIHESIHEVTNDHYNTILNRVRRGH
ncbi:hypothetical protein BDZ97DRAFT_1844498 [Flammula alnicola]|nr:hypothetical protein BDZ97DRAFT_1844498 [Flammula alnicola]